MNQLLTPEASHLSEKMCPGCVGASCPGPGQVGYGWLPGAGCAKCLLSPANPEPGASDSVYVILGTHRRDSASDTPLCSGAKGLQGEEERGKALCPAVATDAHALLLARMVFLSCPSWSLPGVLLTPYPFWLGLMCPIFIPTSEVRKVGGGPVWLCAFSVAPRILPRTWNVTQAT